MKTFFDCIPCFVRQSLDSVRMVTDNEAIHEQLLREVLRALSQMNLRQSPRRWRSISTALFEN